MSDVDASSLELLPAAADQSSVQRTTVDEIEGCTSSADAIRSVDGWIQPDSFHQTAPETCKWPSPPPTKGPCLKRRRAHANNVWATGQSTMMYSVCPCRFVVFVSVRTSVSSRPQPRNCEMLNSTISPVRRRQWKLRNKATAKKAWPSRRAWPHNAKSASTGRGGVWTLAASLLHVPKSRHTPGKTRRVEYHH